MLGKAQQLLKGRSVGWNDGTARTSSLLGAMETPSSFLSHFLYSVPKARGYQDLVTLPTQAEAKVVKEKLCHMWIPKGIG